MREREGERERERNKGSSFVELLSNFAFFWMSEKESKTFLTNCSQMVWKVERTTSTTTTAATNNNNGNGYGNNINKKQQTTQHWSKFQQEQKTNRSFSNYFPIVTATACFISCWDTKFTSVEQILRVIWLAASLLWNKYNVCTYDCRSTLIIEKLK